MGVITKLTQQLREVDTKPKQSKPWGEQSRQEVWVETSFTSLCQPETQQLVAQLLTLTHNLLELGKNGKDSWLR